MERKKVEKLTFIVNTLILITVFGLMGFFYMIDVPFLVYFSIPTVCIYLIGYILISTRHLDIYVWMVYIWLTLYMGITTVCLGYDFGFHLYCMSMIPVMFVSEYLSYKLGDRSLKALPVCIAVCLVYLICTGYTSYNGPVYDVDKTAAGIFWNLNSIIVFGFLIYYTNWMIKLVINSENKLKEMAQVDNLTKLYNRHYMKEILNASESGDGRYLAIADIDHFKNINDTYGHNAGDLVLKKLAVILKENFKGADICRWGGEEFLILESGNIESGKNRFEAFRDALKNTDFIYEDQKITVTITAGLSVREPGQSVDKWVQSADNKLYYGKEHGRDQIVI